MRIAITGGREHAPTSTEMARFWALWYELGGTVLVHGGARGVDSIVGEHVEGDGYVVEAYPPDTALDGPYPWAPKVRNGRMLRTGVGALVQFPGNRGTLDCTEKATDMGIPVYGVALP